ncbi:MAG: hypothetical protein ACP59X_00655 [Solidesulfovibrio sp. DCME]|uniref:hypothetical protein n=1 Tax=Solidesulfovibrio sp. DCME TaxID=3447380 RepID=UPI003D14EFF1
MKNATFPFYLGEPGYRVSSFRAVDSKIFKMFLSDRKSHLREESFPIVDAYKVFMLTLKKNLEDNPVDRFSNICNELFQDFGNPIDKKSGRDMSQVLILIKNNILNEVPVAEEDANLLYDFLFEEEDENFEKQMHLLRWIGFDLEVWDNCFLKINLSNDSGKIKQCFSDIAISGMRGLTNYIILNFDNEIPISGVRYFRIVGERFCIYIELATHLSPEYSKTSRFYLMSTLMEAAYLDGKIVRESEMYLYTSLKAMQSRGIREGSTLNSERKKEWLGAVEEFVDTEYANGSLFTTKQMVEYVMTIDAFRGLRKSPIEGMVRSVKKKYGIDDRKNNRIIRQKDKQKNED